MTFGTRESSRNLGQPLELFRFETGARVFRYCNGDDAYTFDGELYEAVPIRHDAIKSGANIDRAVIAVYVVDTTPLADLLKAYPLSSVMRLTIRQGHPADGDFKVAWVGRVGGAKGTGEGERVMTGQPLATSLKRIGLRRNWQYPCPHVLYGPYCRASQAAASVSVTVSARSGNTVTLPNGWQGGKDAAKFVGGLFGWTDAGGAQVRTIIKVVGNTLTLAGPASFPSGISATVSLGCNHLTTDCSTIHVPVDENAPSNIHNFGGQPFIPTVNPVGFVSNYQ